MGTPRTPAHASSVLGLRTCLVLLFLAALLPAFAINLVTTWDLRAALSARAHTSAMRLARLLAAEFQGTMRGTSQLLRLMDDNPGVHQGGAECEAALQHFRELGGPYSGFGVGDGQGRLRCSVPHGNSSEVLDRGLLAQLQAGRDFFVGPTQIGPLSGKVVVLAAQAVRSGGALTGIMVTGIDLAYLNDLASRIELPHGASFTIVTETGAIVARYPDPAKLVGHAVIEVPGLDRMLTNAGEGEFESEDEDGATRVFAYAPLEAGGARLIVAVDLPRDELLLPATLTWRHNMLGLALAALLALAAATVGGDIFLRRPIVRMLKTANDIARGDLSARAGASGAPGELGRLAQGIDEMAEGLQARDAQLAALSGRILEVQEQERRALAGELHDEIGQVLTSLKLLLEQHLHGETADRRPRLDEAIASCERTLQQVRGLSLDLRPAMLDHLGLATTLEWYVAREGERTGVAAECHIDPPELPVPTRLETALFRIAQEALTNIARHAHATHIVVSLVGDGDRLELAVRDDGVGFDVEAARARGRAGSSLGLLGMAERAALIGARLTVTSDACGSEVRVTVDGSASPEPPGPTSAL